MKQRSSRRPSFLETLGPACIVGALGILVTELDSCSAIAAVVAEDSFSYDRGAFHSAPGGSGWKETEGWKLPQRPSHYVSESGLQYSCGQVTIGTGGAIVVHGTHERNNPLRRQLQSPFSGDTLFVRFLVRYRGDAIDEGIADDGEFFVLWLDDIDGGDGALHNANVPNIGVRINDDRRSRLSQNLFMGRVGAQNTSFSNIELEGDRTYLLVVRLAKTRPGITGAYDHLELWIDPHPAKTDRPPDATVHGGNLNTIHWVGFATGKRTEPGDRIWIDELVIGEEWQDVLPMSSSRSKLADSPSSYQASAGRVDFRDDVYPILRARCFACHQGPDAESGYRLDVHEEILGFSQGRPVAVAGQSSESRLIEVLVTDKENARMPQGLDPLPEDEIAVLRAWIDQGISWDEELLPPVRAGIDHWAFQPLRRPPVPSAEGNTWIKNPIDAFIAAQHAGLKIAPAPPADLPTLARRVALVLTGLPPAPEDIARWSSCGSEASIDAWMENLLASPHYGERWGRHWLDVARWAESNGHQHNRLRQHAWRYRDFVIRSFAEDKPFDQFIREQVAGDELPYSDEHLIATGFLAAARYSGNEMDKTIQRNEILVDIVNATSSALMGLTMACAQCHNHKFDPITARDYYRMQGFFVKGQPGNLILRGEDPQPSKPEEALARAVEEQKQLVSEARTRLEAAERKRGVPDPIVITPERAIGSLSKEKKKRFDELSAQIAARNQTWGFYSPAASFARIEVPWMPLRWPLPYAPSVLKRAKAVLYIRGDVTDPGPEVDIGWPAVFGPTPSDRQMEEQPRTALANWLTSRENPLTARVWANRVWQYYFGRGLVETPNNFGVSGREPSHPALLDWLAVELIESGWSTKHLHRLILSSNTFRQSSQFSEDAARLDPENRLLWRWPVRRLEAESIRDSILAVAGILDTSVGGPSVSKRQRDTSTRRTIYLVQKRADMPLVQKMFDGPSSLTSCGRRRTSTVPLQPLYLLNNPRMVEYAEALAARIAREAGDQLARQVEWAFLSALGRKPRPAELQRVLRFLQADSSSPADQHPQKPAGDEGPSRRFVQFCHAVFNLNEFSYIP